MYKNIGFFLNERIILILFITTLCYNVFGCDEPEENFGRLPQFNIISRSIRGLPSGEQIAKPTAIAPYFDLII